MLTNSSSTTTLRDQFAIRQTGFFLLTPSPWPLFSSFAVFLMLTGFAGYMNYYLNGLFCFFLGVFFVILAFVFWCRDLIRELTFLGRSSLWLNLTYVGPFDFLLSQKHFSFLAFFELFFIPHLSL